MTNDEQWLNEWALPFAKEFEKLGPHTDCKTYAQPYVCPAGKLTIFYGHVIRPGEENKYLAGMSIPQALALYRKSKDRKEFLAKVPRQPLSDAEPLLRKELPLYWMAIAKMVKRPVTPCQKASFAEFAHNVGVGGFEGSSVLREFNAGNIKAARDAFAMWNKMQDPDDPTGKRKIYAAGLARRRRCTQDVFDGKPISHLKAVNWYHGQF